MNRIPVREMVKNAVIELGGKATYSQIIDWIDKKYDNVNKSTIRTQTVACSVNQPSRINLPECGKPREHDDRYDFLYNVGRGQVELYDPITHGNWSLVHHQGKTTIAKDGIPITTNDSTDSSLLEFLQNKIQMNANYQPIVIKTLLEKGNTENYSTTIQEIKEKITTLNFNRENFEINNAIDAVSGALKKYVRFDDVVSLNSEYFTEDEIPKCLEICNREIAKWHVKSIMNEENSVYIIQAGGNGVWLNEFLESKTAGVSYHEYAIFDLTGMQKEEIARKTGGKHETALYNISQIKHGDIIAVTKGSKKGIEIFGIATSKYYFEDTSQTYRHRVNVEYLNFGTDKINSDTPKAIIKSNSLESLIKEFLLGKITMKEHSFFILTQNPDSKYDDVEGQQYQYDNFKNNSKLLTQGSRFVIQSKINNTNYFVGYGKVGSIDTSSGTNETGRQITKFVAKFSEYKKFDSPIQRTPEIFENMKSMKAYGSQPPAILPITRQLYKKITGQDIDDESEQITVSADFSDILLKKKQIIFYGPPGTGKTYHSVLLAEQFTKDNSSQPQKMTFRSAIIKILKEADKPMHYTDITKKILDTELVQTSGETPHYTVVKILSKDIQNKGEHSLFIKTDKGIYKLNPDSQEYETKFNDSIQEEPRYIRSVTFHQSYSYEEFIEGIRPHTIGNQISYELEDGIFKQMVEDAKADSSNRYVLLIDEINRGNISKIFGELITLIEKDKRDNHTLQLAYSKEEFDIPSNLYIIGTMNTADRSLVQIDAALRRRFAFCELMPKPELLTQNIEGISLQTLLTILNQRISKEGLREKQVGHSYLMGVNNLEDLHFVFTHEIVPLLQDYFFDDYKKLENDILSDDFVDSESMTIKDDWQENSSRFLEILKSAFP